MIALNIKEVEQLFEARALKEKTDHLQKLREKLAVSKEKSARNTAENDDAHAEDGEDLFTTPPVTPTKGDGEVAEVSSSTPKALAATQWEVGQRVKVDDRGVGTILYIGEIPRQSGLWYGVALDKVGNG